ncbi:MAG TPA: ABC transporter ATP-binding protein [Anaerolineae bacterium]|jgi:peptide/nickel transport system ATP-binding protein|nr:ABC transporter ATP-binding protein [Anaerolineae bacterium]
MSTPLVDIDDLTIGYHTKRGKLVHVLRNLSLCIEAGDTLGLVGESGCGKSTLGQAMMGFLRSGSKLLAGSVHFSDLDMFNLTSRQLENIRGNQIALIPQNAGESLTPTLRVGNQIVEAIELHTELSGREADERMISLLGQVRLPQPEVMAKRYPHELSGGQQQRVVVAMALAAEPEMLVLDEPTTGLDVTTQAHVLDLLRDIVSEMGTAMMYISHDMGVIARVSDRVALMYAGEIVEDATAAEMFRTPAHPYARGLLESIPRLSLAGIAKSMPGQPPIPGTLPGCSFAPRCPFVTSICTVEPPLLKAIHETSHLVRCHHWEEVLATDFDEELREVFHTIERVAQDDTALELSDVKISYYRPGIISRLRSTPDPPATVSDVTLTVRRGETLALVGESGSGKTTIVRAIAGLLPAKGGHIQFGDFDLTVDVDDRTIELSKRIQMIFQNPDASLNPRHSVAEIIDQPLKRYYPKMTRDERRARQVELLNRVRLNEKYRLRYPGQLSGGEKQRVAIARAFAADPEIVLCDEVTSALDVSVQAAVLDLLADLQRERNTTYIFITHDLAVVRAFADRVAVLYQGRLCEIGTVDEIYTPPYHPYTETLLGAVLEPDPDAKPILLASDTPEMAPPATGCPFKRRCPRHLGQICNEVTPDWKIPNDSKGHMIRCHIDVEELASEQTALVG